jgi:hypothetical protein
VTVLDQFLTEAFPPPKKPAAGAGKPPAAGAAPAGPAKPPFGGPKPSFPPVKLGAAKGTGDSDPMAGGAGGDEAGADPNMSGDGMEIFQMQQQMEQERERQEAEARAAKEAEEQAEREKVKRMRAAADAEVTDALDDAYNDMDDQVVFYPSIDQIGISTDGKESFATHLDKKMGLDDEDGEGDEQGGDAAPDEDADEDEQSLKPKKSSGPTQDAEDENNPADAEDTDEDEAIADDSGEDEAEPDASDDDTADGRDREVGDDEDEAENDVDHIGDGPVPGKPGQRVMPKIADEDDEKDEQDSFEINPEEDEDGEKDPDAEFDKELAGDEATEAGDEDGESEKPDAKAGKSGGKVPPVGDADPDASDDEDPEQAGSAVGQEDENGEEEDPRKNGPYPHPDDVETNVHDGIFPPKPDKEDEVDKVALAAQEMDGEDEFANDPDAQPDDLDKELDGMKGDAKKPKGTDKDSGDDTDSNGVPTKPIKASKLKLKVNQKDVKIKKE